MCLILTGWDAHPDFAFVLAANRDEFFARSSLAMHWWNDRPVLGGRDLTAGGGWLTFTETGRFAAVTNVRDFSREEVSERSRGEIPVDFCCADATPVDFLEAMPRAEYTGYNALVTDLDTLGWASNRAGEPTSLDAGVYGLSNAALDTPWPKVVTGKQRFAHALDAGAEPEDLFAVLADRTVPPDDQLPDTGAGPEIERLVSSAFIVSLDYGTVASTVLRVRRDGSYDVAERRFHAGEETGRVAFAGRLAQPGQ